MEAEFLFRQPEWLIFVLLMLALFSAVMLGWRLAQKYRSDTDPDSLSDVRGVQGAVLGLLALLLGFTFSMAAQRFDGRKSLILDESNAIGTAYLRCDLVAEPERHLLKGLLTRYVDTRVEFYRSGVDDAKQNAVNTESERLHTELWKHTAVAAERSPTATTGLLVSAMNDVIDFHAKRVASLGNHVPTLILWLLLLVATLAAGLTGYAAGFGKRPSRIPTIVVLSIIAFVIVAIIDLDRPRRGLIQAGQNSMLDLQRSLRQAAAATR